jgi:hypothetical protein
LTLREIRAPAVYSAKVPLAVFKDISHERGIPQQALIAEGLNYVITSYRRRAAAP